MEKDFWKSLDKYFEENSLDEVIPYLEEIIFTAPQPLELARSARTLADLHLSNSKDAQKKKAIGYALLAALSQIHLKRLAPAAAILDLLRTRPEAKEASLLLESLIAETFSMKEQSEDSLKTPAESPQARTSHFKNEIPLFSRLTNQETKALLQKATRRNLKAGEVLFKEGDEAQAFYIIAEGEMECRNSRGLELFFHEGNFFGEVALLSRRKRAATLTAHKDTELLEFSKDALIQNFIAFKGFEARFMQFYYWRLFQSLAKEHPHLKDYSEDELSHFFYFFKPIRVLKGHALIQQYEVPTRLLFLLDGEVEVLMNNTNLGRLKPGEFIGEKGMIEKVPRSAQVMSVESCDLLECEDFLFHQLCTQFPKLQAWLEKIITERAKKSLAVFD
jgi:CRP-like cAMP-binding protein